MPMNLNNTTPAAPGGNTNVTWQKDGSGNVSAYVSASGSASSGLRSALPGSPVAGQVYYCTDAPWTYEYNGSKWVGRWRGAPADDPSMLTATPVQYYPNTSAHNASTTLGGVVLTGTSTGSDTCYYYCWPVPASTTLKVSLGFAGGGGPAVINTNTNAGMLFRATDFHDIYYTQYSITTGYVSNAANFDTGGLWPEGYWGLTFGSNSWALGCFVDPNMTVPAYVGSLGLSGTLAYVGSNFTHIGFGTSAGGAMAASWLWHWRQVSA